MTATKKEPEVKYPMHEKLKALGPSRVTVQSFIDWLFDQQGWEICEEAEYERGDSDRDRLIPIRKRREDIMALFFGIDLKILDNEKRTMLDHIRAQNERRTKAGT